MSTESDDKKERLESLDEREKEVLKRIIEDTDFKVAEVAKSMLLGESTLRAVMTSIYKKLEVPSGERDKRGYIVREYQETQIEIPKQPELPQTEPEIFFTPPKLKVSTKFVDKVWRYVMIFCFVVLVILLISIGLYLNGFRAP